MNLYWLVLGLVCSGIASAGGTPDGSGATLSPQAMLEIATLPREQFVSEWDQRREAEIAAIDPEFSPDTRAGSMVRIQFRHAQGRVMYPFFHWRETNASVIETDPSLGKVLAHLPPIDARLWEFAEVRDFMDARLQALARSRLGGDSDLSRGDARWLRAKLRSLEDVLPDRHLWMRKATDIIAKHVEDDGACGIGEAIVAWRARSPPAEWLRKIDEAIAADRAHAAKARSFVYREVGGVPLHLYLLQPVDPRQRPVPVMLWLHGGSATEGTWWHSPVTMHALLDSGVAVIGVELTTGNRFDRDADQVTDAGAAFEYVRTHAEDLGVDPRRIGVAGFSSGASVALLLATRGAGPSGATTESAGSFPRPTAVIVSGACADPLSQGSDGYFRKSMAPGRDPADLSPFAQVRSGSPPVLAIHGTADEFCSHEDMAKFADRYRAAGNPITLVSVDGASHFFGFFQEKGQRAQREAIVAALERWEW
jgi:acetyl esterase/lipase